MTTRRDLSTASWRTSSRSNGDGGVCVGAADDLPGIVPVRDSEHTDTEGPVLVLTADAWAPFVTAVGVGAP
jgi:hypothetical protein